uniref:Uncharacterized protein n=1 Tax=Anguilla anguilla TaxID=7936 RepID=A0A0E9WYX6_ANGAN
MIFSEYYFEKAARVSRFGKIPSKSQCGLLSNYIQQTTHPSQLCKLYHFGEFCQIWPPWTLT